jgi:hypothetical protein
MTLVGVSTGEDEVGNGDKIGKESVGEGMAGAGVGISCQAVKVLTSSSCPLFW